MLPSRIHEPPRSIHVFASYWVEVHCQTLPAMSSAPQGLAPAGRPPAELGWLFRPLVELQRRVGSGSSFPHGNLLPSGPRAAFSHSISVGNLTPAHSQYSIASVTRTLTIG